LVTRREDQDRIRTETVARVVDGVVEQAQRAGTPLSDILDESLYWEHERLRNDRGSPTHAADSQFWGDIRRGLRRSPDHGHRELLRRSVQHYVDEIAGNFDPRIYQAVTRALPPTLGLVLNAVSPMRLARRFPELPSLDHAVTIQGETEHLRHLRDRGTVILVPTHVSNMDSLVIGYSLYRMGLPPFVYGAGLNLFRNRLMGFFMHNLGAYTVDRKKRDPLYKTALKTYATLSLELGYDNLFFPGGTRARSGAVEAHLKLGLMGSGLEAYINNIKAGRTNPNIYIVPATLSYQLVLEAETLIEDFLKEVGSSRYVIDDDEFSRPRTIFSFMTKLVSLDSKIHVTVSRAVDPFGNPVDDEGRSLDPRGRPIDVARYTWRDGAPEHDPVRDAEYVREAGDAVAKAYLRDNVVDSTHVTAQATFDVLRERHPGLDIFRLIRTRGENDEMPLADVTRRADVLLGALRDLERQGRVRLGPSCSGLADEVLADGLAHFAIYHSRPAAERHGDRVRAGDPSLLLYYQNRLEGYDLPGHRPVLSTDRTRLVEGER
jgi:glycerol-3-phosphate O-acyltransferase